MVGLHNTFGATPAPEAPKAPGRGKAQRGAKRKRRLTAADLRALGADPGRPRRVIPPDGGPQRVEVPKPPRTMRGAR